MPIFVSGKTLCPLCRQPIEREQPRVGFPSFLKSTHSLSILSDAVAHRGCFEQWQHRELFVTLFEKFKRILDERPQDTGWKEGEEWIRVRGEEFDREAEALDPANRRM
jgi:hypothetical protein